jgi:hypothetical protein
MPPHRRTWRGIHGDIQYAEMRIRRAAAASYIFGWVALAGALWEGFVAHAWAQARPLLALCAAGLLLAYLTYRHVRAAAAVLLVGYVASAVWYTWHSEIALYLGYIFVIGFGAISGAFHVFRLPKLYGEFLTTWTPRDAGLGDVYTVRDGPQFGVVKVLAVEAERVHVRQYRLRYSERPWQVKSSTLASDRGAGQAFPHLPLDRAEFLRWEPMLLRPEPLEPKELEALEAWRALHQRGAAEHAPAG